MKTAFVPEAGDFVWLTLDPQTGREQAGRRPALVSCSIANQAKGYPFEVVVPAGRGATGVILADHLKSIDWKACYAERLGRCTDEVMGEVRDSPRTALPHDPSESADIVLAASATQSQMCNRQIAAEMFGRLRVRSIDILAWKCPMIALSVIMITVGERPVRQQITGADAR